MGNFGELRLVCRAGNRRKHGGFYLP